MSSSTSALLGSAVILWWLFALLVGFVFGALLPLMAWSVTRNIKGIRRELERLNTNIEVHNAGASQRGDLPLQARAADVPRAVGMGGYYS